MGLSRPTGSFFDLPGLLNLFKQTFVILNNL